MQVGISGGGGLRFEGERRVCSFFRILFDVGPKGNGFCNREALVTPPSKILTLLYLCDCYRIFLEG